MPTVQRLGPSQHCRELGLGLFLGWLGSAAVVFLGVMQHKSVESKSQLSSSLARLSETQAAQTFVSRKKKQVTTPGGYLLRQ